MFWMDKPSLKLAMCHTDGEIQGFIECGELNGGVTITEMWSEIDFMISWGSTMIRWSRNFIITTIITCEYKY